MDGAGAGDGLDGYCLLRGMLEDFDGGVVGRLYTLLLPGGAVSS